MNSTQLFTSIVLSTVLFFSMAKAEFSVPSAISPAIEERNTPESKLLLSYFNQLTSIRTTLPTITTFPDTNELIEKRNAYEEPPVIGVPMKISELENTNSIQDNFIQMKTTTGGTLFGIRIHSPDAIGLRLGLLIENIPDEVAIAFFTDNANTPVTTPITGQNIKALLNLNRAAGDLSPEGRTYWSPIIDGNKAIVLLYVPLSIDSQEIRLSITQASFIFQNPLTEKTAGYCNLDVACYPDWSKQAQSVAKMAFTSSGHSYLCTGNLINDSDTLTTVPYFLSANHCISTQTAASTLQTYWFEQSASCNGSTLDSRYATRTGGATLLYASANTDTSFMRLNDQLPAGINYLGWTTTDLASNGAVTGIHHPSGDWKKISFGNLVGYLDCSGSNGFSCLTATNTTGEFLEIRWNQGVTESGSSGSVLLNGSGQVVGQLYGGSSYCSSPQDTDVYGRFNLAYTAALNQWLGNGTTATLPIAPSNLRITVVSSTQISLNWTDNSNNENGFKIERKTGLSGTWAQIATVGANVLSYQNTGLTASTLYYYRIRSYNSTGNSAYSNEISATTSAVTLPVAPSNLQATVISSTQIKLSWIDNSNNETGFKIERKTGLSGIWTQIGTVSTNVLSYQNTGLTASTLYYYRIRSYNSAGNSAYSNQTSATTSTASALLIAPSNLKATAVSSSKINLTWTDNSNNETGFKIESKKGSYSVWVEIGMVGANITSYQHINLLSAMKYYYRIRAYNSNGNSAYSNEISAITNPW